MERLYEGTLVHGTGIVRSFGSGSRKVEVLRGLDVTVEAGELVALYGPSGSGKTTLLNLIGALDKPDDGKIDVLGKNIVRMRQGRRTRLRRKKLGFIFQNYTLVQSYTSAENIDLALRLPGLSFFERRKRIKSALEAVGLSAWASHMPGQLSGGQRQRVAIARALALRPAIILADEPTSGLDTRTAKQVLKLFQGIARAQGTAFLIVSHDGEVAKYVDVTYDLHEGKLQQRETIEEIEEVEAKPIEIETHSESADSEDAEVPIENEAHSERVDTEDEEIFIPEDVPEIADMVILPGIDDGDSTNAETPQHTEPEDDFDMLTNIAEDSTR